MPGLSRNLISERREWLNMRSRILKEDAMVMLWRDDGNMLSARIRDQEHLYMIRYKHRPGAAPEGNAAEMGARAQPVAATASLRAYRPATRCSRAATCQPQQDMEVRRT